jgi:hypothetical protein
MWIDATKRKPTSMTEVLVVTRRRHVTLGHYNYSKGEWYDHESYDPIPVSHWQEKPLPPDFED